MQEVVRPFCSMAESQGVEVGMVFDFQERDQSACPVSDLYVTFVFLLTAATVFPWH